MKLCSAKDRPFSTTQLLYKFPNDFVSNNTINLIMYDIKDYVSYIEKTYKIKLDKEKEEIENSRSYFSNMTNSMAVYAMSICKNCLWIRYKC